MRSALLTAKNAIRRARDPGPVDVWAGGSTTHRVYAGPDRESTFLRFRPLFFRARRVPATPLAVDEGTHARPRPRVDLDRVLRRGTAVLVPAPARHGVPDVDRRTPIGDRLHVLVPRAGHAEAAVGAVARRGRRPPA